jgi:hypothetical protein
MTAALLVVAPLLLVPGAGAALAVAAPGRISIESRIALAFGLGYALAAGVAVVLALAHVFHRPVLIAGLVFVTIGVWTLALRRAPVREHVGALRAQAREAPFALAASLAFLFAVAVARLFYPPEASLAIRSAWRYWADGLEVAAAGHVPETSGQWGIEIPTTVSKVVLNAFEGGVSFLIGPDPLPGMFAILTLTAVGLTAALLALGRELGLGMFAPLVPVLAVLVPSRLPLSQALSNDLKWYTAEDMGRLVAFCALLVGIQAVRAQDGRVPAAVAGLLLTVAGLTHLISALVAGLMLAWFGVAVVILERTRWRAVGVKALAAGAAFLVTYVGVLALSGGDLGFQRATSGAEFEGLPADIDPTRSFVRGEFVERIPVEGDFYIAPSTVVAGYGRATIARGDGEAGLVVLVALAAASVWMVWRVRTFFPLATIAWGLGLTALAVALFFSYRYDTRIPADFGVRRLYQYAVLVPALLVPALLETLALRFLRERRLLTVVLPLLAGAVAIVLAVSRIPADRSLTRAEAGLNVIERVAEVVPCNVRMLVNARSAGTWEANTGRRAVTEGMAPYLRPEVMGQVLPVLIGANEFFDDPEENRDFLERQRVQYLVVVQPGPWIGSRGARFPEEGDAEAVRALPDVHEVYRDERVAIFAVGSAPSATQPRQPTHCPL